MKHPLIKLAELVSGLNPKCLQLGSGMMAEMQDLAKKGLAEQIPDVREDKKTGQFFPTVNGVDISPTSFEEFRALEIAKKACNY